MGQCAFLTHQRQSISCPFGHSCQGSAMKRLCSSPIRTYTGNKRPGCLAVGASLPTSLDLEPQSRVTAYIGVEPLDFFKQLVSPDLMPHGYCYLWNPWLVWLHVISDAFITLSYYCIPLILIYFIRKNRDLSLNRIFWMSELHPGLWHDPPNGDMERLARRLFLGGCDQGRHCNCLRAHGGNAHTTGAESYFCAWSNESA